MKSRLMMLGGLVAAVALAMVGTAGLAQLGGQQQSPNGAAESAEGVVSSGGVPPTIMQSRLERFLQQPGVVVTRAYTDVGRMQLDNRVDLHVLAIEASAPSGKAYGISIQFGDAGAPESLVDEEGIDPLLAGLESLGKVERGSGNKMLNAEARYRIPTGLEIANVDSEGARRATIHAVQVVWPTGQILEASGSFLPQRLEELRRLINGAKDRIAAAKAAG